MADFTMSTYLSSGSGPTDAHHAMNALLMRVLLAVAQRRQDELPGLEKLLQTEVLLTTGESSGRAYGWFKPCSWQHGDRAVHELFIDADFDNHEPDIETAEHVLVTLVHEGAHAFAKAKGVKDTSRGGSYHNRQFADIAFQIGLRVDSDDRIGHHTPRLSTRGRRDYADLLGELERGLVLVRQPRPTKAARVRAEEASPAIGAVGDAT